MSNESHKKVFQRSIVSITGEYTQKQLKTLSEFMHADFPHWETGGGRRNGILRIECPNSGICSQGEWVDSLNQIVLPEYDTFHAALKNRKMIVRFVPKLTDFKEGVEIGGHGHVVKAGGNTEYWYRIPILDSTNNLANQKQLLFMLMHELTETDFWRKTTPGEWITLLSEDNKSIEYLKDGHDVEYSQLTDENIANRRAWRALRRKWPNIQDERIIAYPIADVDL